MSNTKMIFLIQCLEPKILNENDNVLFDILTYRIKYTHCYVKRQLSHFASRDVTSTK